MLEHDDDVRDHYDQRAHGWLRIPAGVDGPRGVIRVVDGDTVVVAPDTTVRLIGIDTPETVDPRKPVQCFGREASAHAHTLLDGHSVWLEYDPTQGRLDKYGRTLAYVWLPDRRMFNEVMIDDGYAHEYTYDLPYRYQDSFIAAERAARDGIGGCGHRPPATATRRARRPLRRRPARFVPAVIRRTRLCASRHRRPISTAPTSRTGASPSSVPTHTASMPTTTALAARADAGSHAG